MCRAELNLIKSQIQVDLSQFSIFKNKNRSQWFPCALSLIVYLAFSVTTQLARACDLNAPMLACSQLLTPPRSNYHRCLDLCWPACVHSYRSEGKHGEERRWGRADRAVGKPASGLQTQDSCSDESAQRKSWLIGTKCSRVAQAAGTKVSVTRRSAVQTTLTAYTSRTSERWK